MRVPHANAGRISPIVPPCICRTPPTCPANTFIPIMTTSIRTYRQLLLPPEYQAAASTRPVPLLPPEIWAQIAAELLLLDEPIWVAWKRYRTVSPVFKQAIEDSYLAHVVRGARIYVDCGPSLPLPPPVHSYYGEYWFDGFDDKEERLAVLRLNEDRCTFGRSRTDRDSEISSSDRHKWLVRDYTGF